MPPLQAALLLSVFFLIGAAFLIAALLDLMEAKRFSATIMGFIGLGLVVAPTIIGLGMVLERIK